MYKLIDLFKCYCFIKYVKILEQIDRFKNCTQKKKSPAIKSIAREINQRDMHKQLQL